MRHVPADGRERASPKNACANSIEISGVIAVRLSAPGGGLSPIRRALGP
ncbi:MAG: hypothetical protein ACLPYS_09805 [Vulcanimicrobiaceae bacterium]